MRLFHSSVDIKVMKCAQLLVRRVDPQCHCDPHSRVRLPDDQQRIFGFLLGVLQRISTIEQPLEQATNTSVSILARPGHERVYEGAHPARDGGD